MSAPPLPRSLTARGIYLLAPGEVLPVLCALTSNRYGTEHSHALAEFAARAWTLGMAMAADESPEESEAA